MKDKFWLDKWEQQNIGFHRTEVNDKIVNNLSKLNLNVGDTVLVPLCGKTLDMFWLSEQGFKVVGIELSVIAIRDFFSEHAIECKMETSEKYTKYYSDNISLYCGDIFEISKSDIGEIHAIYDRAATIALPAEIRPKYISHMIDLSNNKLNILMVLIEYDQSEADGPPFCVTDEEIQRSFSGFSCEKISKKDINDLPPRFQNITNGVFEKVFYIS